MHLPGLRREGGGGALRRRLAGGEVHIKELATGAAAAGARAQQRAARAGAVARAGAGARTRVGRGALLGVRGQPAQPPDAVLGQAAQLLACRLQARRPRRLPGSGNPQNNPPPKALVCSAIVPQGACLMFLWAWASMPPAAH